MFEAFPLCSIRINRPRQPLPPCYCSFFCLFPCDSCVFFLACHVVVRPTTLGAGPAGSADVRPRREVGQGDCAPAAAQRVAHDGVGRRGRLRVHEIRAAPPQRRLRARPVLHLRTGKSEQ